MIRSNAPCHATFWNPRALATSSDYPEAAEMVSLQDQIGFDTVDTSPLSESWRADRDRPAYEARQNKDQLVANLATAPRAL